VFLVRSSLNWHLLVVLELVASLIGLVSTLPDLVQLHLVEAGANYTHAVIEVGGQLTGGVHCSVLLACFLLNGLAFVIDVLCDLA
jgi:hypothetical protein